MEGTAWVWIANYIAIYYMAELGWPATVLSQEDERY